MNVRDNPVKTTLPIVVVVAWFAQDLTEWGVDQLLAVLDPSAAAAFGLSLHALALAVVTAVAVQLGGWVQRHLTEPKGVLDEIIASMAADPKVKTSVYARGRVVEGIGGDPFEGEHR